MLMYKNRGFKDAELLAPGYPDPNMPEREHRHARHAWWRKQVKETRGTPVPRRFAGSWLRAVTFTDEANPRKK